MDMIAVNSGIVYELYRARNSQNINSLIALLGIVGLLYYYSWKCQNKNDIQMATYMHCGVHIMGLIIKLILYTGCIDDCK